MKSIVKKIIPAEVCSKVKEINLLISRKIIFLLKSLNVSRIDFTASATLNRTLKSEEEYQKAIQKLRKAGLQPHQTLAKNWDALASLALILNRRNKTAPVLDAGGEVYSPLVDWLFLYGYENLNVINISFGRDFMIGPIRYIRGDCTQTPYPSGYFDVVTCLSVIEHGVDIKEFLTESFRILRTNGILIISTDYWCEPIDTNGKEAYGAKVKVFNPEEIQELVRTAESIGFMKTGEIDYATSKKVVHWERMDLDFTFIIFALKKSERSSCLYS